MRFSLANQTSNTFQGNVRLNGLGCPQCSAPLVDSLNSLINLKNQGNEKECNCTQCDFASTYNVETLKLAKNY